MPITTPMRKIEWDFSGLTALDVIAILHWQNETDIAEAFARMLTIAQGCTDTPLSILNVAETLHIFVEAAQTHLLQQALDKYERKQSIEEDEDETS